MNNILLNIKRYIKVFVFTLVATLFFSNTALAGFCRSECVDQLESDIKLSIKARCPLNTKMKITNIQEENMRGWYRAKTTVHIAIPNKQVKVLQCYFNISDSVLLACDYPEECFINYNDEIDRD